VTTAARTSVPTIAAVLSPGCPSPEAVRRASATTGRARLASWFQTPAIATATPTERRSKPHERSIENEPAMPTAAPAGETIESAVEACVSTIACRKRRPGSADIHGGANVTRLSATAPASRAQSCQSSPRSTSSTSR
jgi:hypothetical protein